MDLNEIKNVKINQIDALYNTERLYKARNSVIKFFDDYSSIISEAKHKTYHGEGIKLLTPKQILQKTTNSIGTNKGR